MDSNDWESLAYFPHDSNAMCDMKSRKLITMHGMAGYGRWWVLCEMMASERLHRLPIADENDRAVLLDALAYESESELDGFLSDIVSIGFIDTEQFNRGWIVSPRMAENAEYAASKRRAGRARQKRA